MQKFLEATKDLPSSPGVYWFIDNDGKHLYISRARDLKSKVRYHLYKSNSRKNKIIQQNFASLGYEPIADRLAASKRELELIKKYYPPLNSRKEGLKQYRYIELTLHEEFPRARKKKTYDTGNEIMLGPFPKSRWIKRILTVAANYYKIADCGKRVVLGDDHKIVKTCIRRRTNQCLKPCEVEVDQEEYMRALDAFSEFFKGERVDLIEYLKEEMKTAAGKQQFEKAKAIKEDLAAIEKLLNFY